MRPDEDPVVTFQLQARTWRQVNTQIRKWLRGLPRVRHLSVTVEVWSRAVRPRDAEDQGGPR